MNTRLLSIITLCLFIVAASCNNDEGNNETNNTDSTDLSQTNSDFENQEFTLPPELKYMTEKPGFVYDKFYPIGWSKDGLFAYIVEPADEESGFYWFEIKIIDIVNNKEIWSWKPSESEEGSLASTWEENYELFAQYLNESEIQQSAFELKPAKTSYKGNDYELVLENQMETDEDYGFEIVKGFKIKMTSPELGEKQCCDKKTNSMDYVLSTYIPGFLLSPHDDRIVIICQQERPGAGGPPNMVYFDLVGADLIRGFEKEDEG